MSDTREEKLQDLDVELQEQQLDFMRARTRLINAQARELEIRDPDLAPLPPPKTIGSGMTYGSALGQLDELLPGIPVKAPAGLSCAAALEALRLGYDITRPSWNLPWELSEEDRNARDWDLVPFATFKSEGETKAKGADYDADR